MEEPDDGIPRAVRRLGRLMRWMMEGKFYGLTQGRGVLWEKYKLYEIRGNTSQSMEILIWTMNNA
jgi:hypothetical protein